MKSVSALAVLVIGLIVVGYSSGVFNKAKDIDTKIDASGVSTTSGSCCQSGGSCCDSTVAATTSEKGSCSGCCKDGATVSTGTCCQNGATASTGTCCKDGATVSTGTCCQNSTDTVSTTQSGDCKCGTGDTECGKCNGTEAASGEDTSAADAPAGENSGN